MILIKQFKSYFISSSKFFCYFFICDLKTIFISFQVNKALRLKEIAKDDSIDEHRTNSRFRVVRKLDSKFDENATKSEIKATKSSNKVINYFNELEYISKGRLASEKDAYVRNKFNQLVSDSIPSDRAIPDTRHSLCKNVNYEIDKLPKSSVIICFHNEVNDES